MQLDYVVFYVADAQRALRFYQEAFGLSPKLVHESGQYVELATGAVTLGFAAHGLAETLVPNGYVHSQPTDRPVGCQISFTVDDVDAAYQKALAAGAQPMSPPEQKPWGFRVAFVRDQDGFLVELCREVQD